MNYRKIQKIRLLREQIAKGLPNPALMEARSQLARMIGEITGVE